MTLTGMSDLQPTSTELKPARGGVSREVKELRLLYRLSGVLDQHPDVTQVIQPVLEALAEHMDLRHGTVTLLNRKTGDILIDLAHGMSQKQVEAGRYKNATDVIRSGLRLLEERETRLEALRHALAEGEESGVAGPLDIEKIKRQARKDADAARS